MLSFQWSLNTSSKKSPLCIYSNAMIVFPSLFSGWCVKIPTTLINPNPVCYWPQCWPHCSPCSVRTGWSCSCNSATWTRCLTWSWLRVSGGHTTSGCPLCPGHCWCCLRTGWSAHCSVHCWVRTGSPWPGPWLCWRAAPSSWPWQTPVSWTERVSSCHDTTHEAALCISGTSPPPPPHPRHYPRRRSQEAGRSISVCQNVCCQEYSPLLPSASGRQPWRVWWDWGWLVRAGPGWSTGLTPHLPRLTLWQRRPVVTEAEETTSGQEHGPRSQWLASKLHQSIRFEVACRILATHRSGISRPH